MTWDIELGLKRTDSYRWPASYDTEGQYGGPQQLPSVDSSGQGSWHPLLYGGFHTLPVNTNPVHSHRLAASFPNTPPLQEPERQQYNVAESRLDSTWAPQRERGDYAILQGIQELPFAASETVRPSTNRRGSSGSLSPHSEASSPPPRMSETFSAVVQRNPRPCRGKRKSAQRPQRKFTVTIPFCCSTPKLKLVCGCCNEESILQIKEDPRPRMIPVATSQLGFCRFCQVNGEEEEFYRNHSLRTDDGRVSCPILRDYNCPICNNKGGDQAHTIKYCPKARKQKP